MLSKDCKEKNSIKFTCFNQLAAAVSTVFQIRRLNDKIKKVKIYTHSPKTYNLMRVRDSYISTGRKSAKEEKALGKANTRSCSVVCTIEGQVVGCFAIRIQWLH